MKKENLSQYYTSFDESTDLQNYTLLKFIKEDPNAKVYQIEDKINNEIFHAKIFPT